VSIFIEPFHIEAEKALLPGDMPGPNDHTDPDFQKNVSFRGMSGLPKPNTNMPGPRLPGTAFPRAVKQWRNWLKIMANTNW
jgi:hypothetical protein